MKGQDEYDLSLILLLLVVVVVMLSLVKKPSLFYVQKDTNMLKAVSEGIQIYTC